MRKIKVPTIGEKTKLQKMGFEAIEILRSGQLIICPTENSYVVIADPQSEIGTQAFVTIKGHDLTTTYPVFVNSVDDLIGLVLGINDKARLLVQQFWPGLLNLQFLTRENLPHNFGGESPPDRLIARKPKSPLINVITELMGPVIYSSLMDSSKKPIKDLENLNAAQRKLVTVAFDGGAIKGKKITTIVSSSHNSIQVLREGSISTWELKQLVSDIKEV